MESQSPRRPPSRRSHAPTPLPCPIMTLTEAIQYYQRTATDFSIAIPEELKRAEYRELYKYYAYKLPFILAWGGTQAGNDYFMKKNRGLPADEILQYEAERNAHLLYNEVHLNAPMEPMPPYEDVVAEADIQMLMPDKPPVPPSPCLCHHLLLRQRTRTTWNVPKRLQTICRCRLLIGRRWRWRRATCSATTSHRTSTMGTTMPSSSSEGTHSSRTMGTHHRECCPL